MRICAGENVALAAVKGLREAGHDVLWIRESAPGIPDTEVLQKAALEQRILLTCDKDFGQLACRQGATSLVGLS